MAAQESCRESYNSGCRELGLGAAAPAPVLHVASCCRFRTVWRPLDTGPPGWPPGAPSLAGLRGGGTRSGRLTCRLQRPCGARCVGCTHPRPHPGGRAAGHSRPLCRSTRTKAITSTASASSSTCSAPSSPSSPSASKSRTSRQPRRQRRRRRRRTERGGLQRLPGTGVGWGTPPRSRGAG